MTDKTVDAVKQLVETVCHILEKQKIFLNDEQIAFLEKKLRVEIGGTQTYYPSKCMDDTENVHRIIQKRIADTKRKLAKELGISVRQVDIAARTPNMTIHPEQLPAKTSDKQQPSLFS